MPVSKVLHPKFTERIKMQFIFKYKKMNRKITIQTGNLITLDNFENIYT